LICPEKTYIKEFVVGTQPDVNMIKVVCSDNTTKIVTAPGGIIERQSMAGAQRIPSDDGFTSVTVDLGAHMKSLTFSNNGTPMNGYGPIIRNGIIPGKLTCSSGKKIVGIKGTYKDYINLIHLYCGGPT